MNNLNIEETKRPTFISVNDRVELVVQDAKMEPLTDDELKRVIQAVKDVDKGEGVPAEDFFKNFKGRHGLKYEV
jgi:hypothetical protein